MTFRSLLLTALFSVFLSAQVTPANAVMLTEKDFITDTEASIEMMPNSGTDMVANYKGEIRTETQGNKHDDAMAHWQVAQRSPLHIRSLPL